MSKRKYNKKHRNGKSFILMIYAAVMFCMTVGVTCAFLIARTNNVKNTFRPGEVTTKVLEKTFNTKVKENVQIKNTGNVQAYIRAKVIVNWKNSEGQVYGKAPALGTDYTIELGDDNWIFANDGFYYWTKAVKSDDEDANNCTTENLISECKPVSGKAPEGYFLNVEIVGSGIQAFPDYVAEDEWSNDLVKIDANNGTLTIINK